MRLMGNRGNLDRQAKDQGNLWSQLTFAQSMLSKLLFVMRPSDAEGLGKRTDQRAELLPVDER